MNRVQIILKALFFGAFITLMSCSSSTNSSSPLVVQVKKQKLAVGIQFEGKIRLSHGAPGFEGTSTEYKHLKQHQGAFTYTDTNGKRVALTTISSIYPNVFGFQLNILGEKTTNGKEFSGFFFDSIPNMTQGVEVWRYKPWNSWTKPIRITSANQLHDWDVQFFYWQYADGLYGAAIPLSGNGYRTTLGSENGRFGCKALTYTADASADSIPMMAVGFGHDPHVLFQQLYEAGLTMMGQSENLRAKKTYPEPFEYIGWCTWNSSHMGRDLDEPHLIKGVETFTKNHFPLGWLLVDDGWFNQSGSRLNAVTPNPQKFPNGFASLNSKLKKDFGLKHVGIWHAYNGYWNGINPDSEVGQQYKEDLFSWKQRESVQDEASPIIEYHFIKPDSKALKQFYSSWHDYFVDQGFSFVKVDNQLVSERMCVDNYPIDELSSKMHNALYESVFSHFNGAVINCMDMTNEAFYHFGKSAVARCVEDYFPEVDGGVGYNLEKGGAAAHVASAVYNALYFSQMVWPDYDMFESYNSHAWYHAAARAISGGPVYVTDQPGKQNFKVLHSLVDLNGKILRADVPGLITEDGLFNVQGASPLKVFSKIGNSGLLAVFNVADSDLVTGAFSVSDVKGIKGDWFAIYEFFSKELIVVNKEATQPLNLERMACRYFNIVPYENNVAIIGLVNKLNAPKTVVESNITDKLIQVKVNGTGEFVACLQYAPASILVNGKKTNDFSFEKGKLAVNIHQVDLSGVATIKIER